MTEKLATVVASPVQRHVREAMGHHSAFRVDQVLPVEILEKLARLDQQVQSKTAA